MTRKVNKITWMAILGFSLAALYVSYVQGQTEETPNMVPYMLKELNSLSEQEEELQGEIEQLENDLETLKSVRSDIDGLSYNGGIQDGLNALSTQNPSVEAIAKAEDLVRSFHDYFLGAIPSTSVNGRLGSVYQDVESTVLSHEDDVVSPLFSVRADLELVKSPQDKAKIYQDALSRVSKKLSAEAFANLKKKCKGIVDSSIQEISREQANDRKDLTGLSREVKKLSNSLQVSQKKQEKKQELDESLFKWGLPVIIAFILALTLINILPRILAIITKNPTLAHEESEHEVLHTVTVFLLIISILILGIRGQIDNASLSTLLAGISGYVLGGQMKKRQEEAETRIPPA